MTTIESNLVPYTTATRLAEVYAERVASIKELLTETAEQLRDLQETFRFDDDERRRGTSFELDVYYLGSHHRLDDDAIAGLIREFKRDAWRIIFDKLNIDSIMSTKRREEMRETLHRCSRRWSGDKLDELPEITADSIMAVLQGTLASAGDYMAEKIREEFDWLRPGVHGMTNYKTNQTSAAAIGRKVIKSWCVEWCSWLKSFDVRRHEKESHLQAVDSIFHYLDGRGPLRDGCRGPLVEAIRASGEEGRGETDFFRFRCFHNGNLHLEFKRLDLLAEFNRRGGENRLARETA